MKPSVKDPKNQLKVVQKQSSDIEISKLYSSQSQQALSDLYKPLRFKGQTTKPKFTKNPPPPTVPQLVKSKQTRCEQTVKSVRSKTLAPRR
jgi:hypothetical protein